MPSVNSNPFLSYNLSPEQTEEGSILSLAQRYVIQNTVAYLAEQKLLLEFDTEYPQKFIQQESYLRGRIESLQDLLLRSEALETSKSFPPSY